MDAHGPALEIDLIERGLRLRDVGTDALPWQDLRAIVAGSRPESALYRDVHGVEAAEWAPIVPQLLAAIFDAIQLNTYYLQRLGGATPDPPAQLPRPGVTPPERTAWAGTPRTMEEIDQLLGWDT